MTIKCGKRVRLKDDGTMRSLSLDELRAKIRELSPQTSTSNLTRHEACAMLDQLQRHIAPLRYDGKNSCYLDTALLALYFNKNKWLDKVTINNKNIEGKARDALNQIVAHIRNPQGSSIKSTVFRSALAHYDPSYNRAFDLEWESTQQEPLDVIHILGRIFNIKDSVYMREYTRSKPRGRRIMGSMASYRIPVSLLKEKLAWNQVFPTQVDKSTGTRLTFIDAPFLYVHIDRNYMDRTKVRTPFQPPFQIVTSKGRILHLVSIIIHLGSNPIHGHYVAIVKSFDDVWLYYDDMSASMLPLPKNKIFTFERNRALRDGVGYIYTP